MCQLVAVDVVSHLSRVTQRGGHLSQVALGVIREGCRLAVGVDDRQRQAVGRVVGPVGADRAAGAGELGHLRDVAQAVVGKIRKSAERIGHRRVTPGGGVQRVARDLLFGQPQREGIGSDVAGAVEIHPPHLAAPIGDFSTRDDTTRQRVSKTEGARIRRRLRA